MAGQGPIEAPLSSWPHFTSVKLGTVAPAVTPLAIPPFLDQAHLVSSVHCAGLSHTSLPTLATPSCTSLPTFTTPSHTSLPTIATPSHPPTCWLPASRQCITFTGTLSYLDFICLDPLN